jgi:hypothetical protein
MLREKETASTRGSGQQQQLLLLQAKRASWLVFGSHHSKDDGIKSHGVHSPAIAATWCGCYAYAIHVSPMQSAIELY